MNEVILLALFPTLVAANVLKWGSSLVPKSRRLTCKECCSTCYRAVAAVFGCGGDVARADAINMIIEKRVAAQMEQSMQMTWFVFTICVCLSSVILCGNLVTKSSRWMSFGQTVVSVVVLFVLTVGNVCLPSEVARRPAFVYSFMMLVTTLHTALVKPNIVSAFLTGGLALFVRTWMSLRYHRLALVFALVFACNLVYLVMVIYTLSTAFPDSARFLITCEIWILVLAVVASAAAARAMRGDIGREVEADILRGESSGLWNLLDLVCDVVVPLDDQLRLKDAAPRFAAMVMSQGRNIEGMRLHGFMPSEEDQQAFE